MSLRCALGGPGRDPRGRTGRVRMAATDAGSGDLSYDVACRIGRRARVARGGGRRASPDVHLLDGLGTRRIPSGPTCGDRPGWSTPHLSRASAAFGRPGRAARRGRCRARVLRRGLPGAFVGVRRRRLRRDAGRSRVPATGRRHAPGPPRVRPVRRGCGSGDLGRPRAAGRPVAHDPGRRADRRPRHTSRPGSVGSRRPRVRDLHVG